MRGIISGIGCTLLFLSGCAGPTFHWLRGENKDDVPTHHGPIAEIISIWQPAEGTGLNNVPARGFAGQVLFLAPGGDAPVRVEGDVRVYVFDDQGTAEERSKPIHQFDFPAKVWDSFAHKGSLGLAYHVFIPYTKSGDHMADCTIRIRLTPTNGPVRFSDGVRVRLVGHVPDQTATATPPAPKSPQHVLQTSANLKSPATRLNDGSTVTAEQQAILDEYRQRSFRPLGRNPVEPAAEFTSRDGDAPRNVVKVSDEHETPMFDEDIERRLQELTSRRHRFGQRTATAPADESAAARTSAPSTHDYHDSRPLGQDSSEEPAVKRFKLTAVANSPTVTDVDSPSAAPQRPESRSTSAVLDRHPLAEPPGWQFRQQTQTHANQHPLAD